MLLRLTYAIVLNNGNILKNFIWGYNSIILQYTQIIPLVPGACQPPTVIWLNNFKKIE
ncbi:hypothetical protein ARTHRO_10800 [Limnospira indica PCC 8005]|uniref:Uncharacterized protein n=1 Tax=Limnospira indica PCC 8005 TaxID=376219 RepID=A0A9P1KCG2_9CYAN|nr:hypothetical protein ARTHRO_10800 [Limnospira indica PCC 8005]